MEHDSFINNEVYSYEYFLQDNICRLCWKKNAAKDIYSKTSEGHCELKNELVYKIQQCLDIDLSLETYPKTLCEICYIKIEEFYEFRSFCRETDEKLRKILENYEGKTSVHLEIAETSVKIEKIDNFPTLDLLESKTDDLDSFLDSLQDLSDNDEILRPITTNSPPKCKSTSKSRVKRKYHLKRGPSYCNICRLDLESVDKFLAHNAEFHGVEDGKFKCFGCDKRFKNGKTRLGHEINFCKGLKDGYKCSICNRCLPKRRMYEAHMRDHRQNVVIELPDDIFNCTKCFHSFKTRESLKAHMNEHEITKNFVCESCGRVFTRQDYLHKHKLTHTGVKQHICPHCGFRSAQRSSLIVHIRKHTGERPYSCDVCPQRCTSSSNLRAHRRRHLGVKKYECTICPKKFGYKTSLEEHIASMHERPAPHPCPHCGATYSRGRGLRRHLLAKHKQVETAEVPATCHKMAEEKACDEIVLKSQDVFVV